MNEEKKEQEEQKEEGFLKKHGLKILIGAGAGAGMIAAYWVGKRNGWNSVFKHLFDLVEARHKEWDEKSSGNRKLIDEQIFSDLAVGIEEAVFSPELETTVISRGYDLGNNLTKMVEVKIENIHGD